MSYFSPEDAKKFIEEKSEEEWIELQKRLMILIVKCYGAYLQDAGIEKEDVFQQAITDTCSGKRRWPVEVKFPTYMAQAMRSIISHIVAREKEKHLSLDKLLEECESKRMFPKELSVWPDHDLKFYCSEIYKKVLERVQSIPDLKEILELIFEKRGDLKPEETALLLRVDVREVNNRLKRLRRLAKAMRKESAK